MTYHFSGPKEPERREPIGEFQRLLDAEIQRVQDEIIWEYRLDVNELVWGSAYGPWPPTHLTGLVTIIEAQ